MTCYIRHLKDIMKELGMDDTKENRKELDMRLRAALKKESASCPEVWKGVKEALHDPEKAAALMARIRSSDAL